MTGVKLRAGRHLQHDAVLAGHGLSPQLAQRLDGLIVACRTGRDALDATGQIVATHAMLGGPRGAHSWRSPPVSCLLTACISPEVIASTSHQIALANLSSGLFSSSD